MKINYQNQKIKRCMVSEKEAIKRYGKQLANKLFKTMQYLDAAPDLSSVSTAAPFRRHKLEGNYKGHFAVNLTENVRLIFCPSGVDKKIPELLEEIKEISIVEIEDYH